jgi:hypothetical protein
MRSVRFLLAAAFICCASSSVFAVEGSTAAGPIGGTDIRSAQLPPPGLYVGGILFGATANDFVDGSGKTIPALSDAHLERKLVAPFFGYVPDVQVLGGSIGLIGTIPYGSECGRLFITTPSRCQTGFGDAYVEADWSRAFGTLRPSKFPDAYPIFQGLTIMLGFGVVFPTGKYDAQLAALQGLTMGNNIYDFAPSVAFTYMTPPIIADGTEISAKLYWNNYLTNPATQYSTGSLLDLDFAISERIGRLQIGAAGFFAFQVADDKQFGVTIPPDGRRAEVLDLGAVVAYDIPELGAFLKVKGLTTVIAANTVRSQGISFAWVQKIR